MSRRTFLVWLDSGANAHSCRKDKYTLEDLEITSDEWDAMSETEQMEFMKGLAFEGMEWGFEEIESEATK